MDMDEQNSTNNWKSFLIILAATLLVWIGVSMSSVNTYPTTLMVEYDGYDTARYAMLSADSTVTINMQTNGFVALHQSIEMRKKPLKVHLQIPPSVEATTDPVPVRLSVAQMINDIKNQYDLSDKVNIQTVTESLHLVVAQRLSKAFHPMMDEVSFTFAPGHCLYGAPRIEPDTVYLYGSSASLAKIDNLKVMRSQISNIGQSGYYTMSLDTIWNKYPDLRISTPEIRIYIPTEECTENSIVVPIHYNHADSLSKVRIYPDKVTVNYWVANKDFDRPQADDFYVEVSNKLSDKGDAHMLTIARFPEYVRIKDLSTDKVQIIVISNSK